jgi:predicted transcriptional regulator
MKTKNESLDERLDLIVELLRRLLALELTRSGVSQADIGRHLHVAKATVGSFLVGVERGKDSG